MNYIQHVNKTINDVVAKKNNVVMFGQNITAGSCISGFTRDLTVKEGNLMIDTPNCENTLCGVGFGAMLNGAHAIFFMKQLDFLLLGIDQIVNTYNFMRLGEIKGSFTIMPVIVDSGFEGPMASINNLSDFCSIARVEGYNVTNKNDVSELISHHLVKPGFRIIGISQRLFRNEIINLDVVDSNADKSYFQYKRGDDVTIVCFNFSLPNGAELSEKFEAEGIKSSLFSVNAVTPINWGAIIEDLKITNNLVLIDDSKSRNLASDNFLSQALDHCSLNFKFVIKRQEKENFYCPNADQLDISYDEIVREFVSSKKDLLQGNRV